MTTEDLKTLACKWIEKASLPNCHGFKFVALLDDGKMEVCRVIRKEDGMHTVEGGLFPRIIGWRNAGL